MNDPIAVSPFRDFVQTATDAMESLTQGLRGARDPSPMLALDTPEGVRMVAVDSEFFRPDLPERRRDLVAKFVLPMIREHGAWRVAIMHAGWLFSPTAPAGPENRENVIVVTAVDGEVSETWWAPREFPAKWTRWPPNRQLGLFVTPIQEALR